MRLILVDRLTEKRANFYPLALSRPVFELRCGMTSLAEKLIAKTRATDVACFVPPYLAEVYRTKTRWPVNDTASLRGDDLLVVHARVKADQLNIPLAGPSEMALDDDGDVLYARIAKSDLAKLKTESIDTFLDSAKIALPQANRSVATWNYTWELVLANSAQLTADFFAIGRSGSEGTIEEPSAIRGSRNNVYVAPGVTVHPMVVIDAEHGPVYLDEGAVIPFLRDRAVPITASSPYLSSLRGGAKFIKGGEPRIQGDKEGSTHWSR